ncbi:hypothetical protein D3C78_1774480 [compost metagenome]
MIYASRHLLDRSPWVTFRRWLTNAVVFVGITLISSAINIPIHSYAGIMLWGVLLGLVILPVYFVIASLMEREVFLYTWGHLKIYRTKLKNKVIARPEVSSLSK